MYIGGSGYFSSYSVSSDLKLEYSSIVNLTSNCRLDVVATLSTY